MTIYNFYSSFYQSGLVLLIISQYLAPAKSSVSQAYVVSTPTNMNMGVFFYLFFIFKLIVLSPLVMRFGQSTSVNSQQKIERGLIVWEFGILCIKGMYYLPRLLDFNKGL